MSNIFATLAPVLAQSAPAPNHGVTGKDGWDLENFFNNSTNYTQKVGGAFLALIGIAGVVWGGFLMIRKLMGGQQAQQDSWFKIVALIIVGGAMLFGGMAILLNLAQGGKKTIENFGNQRSGGTPSGMIIDQFNAIGSNIADGAVVLAGHAADAAAVLPVLV